MLPFLKKQVKHQTGVLVKHRPSDETDPKPDSALETAAKELMSAISSQDAKRTAEALKSAFNCLESEPHDEYNHEESGEQE